MALRVEASAVGHGLPHVGGVSVAQGSTCLLTTSITASTVQAALLELREAEAAGADVVELRLDFLQGFDPATDLRTLLAGTKLPTIVTYRPNWEGGKYAGEEEARLRVLWLAAELKAAFVDVELKAAAPFFAASPQDWQRGKGVTRFILSSHNYSETPSLVDLRALHARAVAAGADIVKIATTAQRIVDIARLEALLSLERSKPTIALGMGEAGLVRRAALHGSGGSERYAVAAARGERAAHAHAAACLQVSRLLAPKFGAFLTFGSLRAGKESAPGQPTLAQLRLTFRLATQARAPPHRACRRARGSHRALNAGRCHARAWRHRQAHLAQSQPGAAQCRSECAWGGHRVRAAARGRLARFPALAAVQPRRLCGLQCDDSAQGGCAAMLRRGARAGFSGACRVLFTRASRADRSIPSPRASVL